MAWPCWCRRSSGAIRLAGRSSCFGDGQGLCLFAKRLEKGRFVWPSPADGCVVLTPAQLGMLLEGIDWRMPVRTWHPQTAG
jgi:transposase